MWYCRSKNKHSQTEVLHLSRNPDQCVLQVNGATLKQVGKFTYLRGAFTSGATQDEKLCKPELARLVVQYCELCTIRLSWNENDRKRQSSQFSKQFLPPFAPMVMDLEQYLNCKILHGRMLLQPWPNAFDMRKFFWGIMSFRPRNWVKNKKKVFQENWRVFVPKTK